MGLGLSLIILPHEMKLSDLNTQTVYANARLDLVRDGNLFSRIHDLVETHSFEAHYHSIEIFGERWPGDDEPNDRLVQVRHLVELYLLPEIQETLQNHAAWSYMLAGCHRDDYVGLYWS